MLPISREYRYPFERISKLSITMERNKNRIIEFEFFELLFDSQINQRKYRNLYYLVN